jgi:hypothetical protein
MLSFDNRPGGAKIPPADTGLCVAQVTLRFLGMVAIVQKNSFKINGSFGDDLYEMQPGHN